MAPDAYPQQYRPLETPRVPLRPLGALSDLVATEMASMLESQGAEALAAYAETILQNTELPPIVDDIGWLDLCMLQAAIVNSGVSMGPLLSDAIAHQADIKSVPAGLTYWSIIGVNPLLQDRRIFTTGAIAESEYMFWKAHQDFEVMAQPNITKLLNALENLDPNNPDLILLETILRDNLPIMQQLITSVTDLRDTMRWEEFNSGFRRFVGTITDRNGKSVAGPSGAFSASVAILTLLLIDNSQLPPYYIDLISNLELFPEHQQHEMLWAAQLAAEGKKVTDLLPGNAVIQQNLELLASFRSRHLSVAYRLPAVASGGAGTSGFSETGKMLYDLDATTRNLAKGEDTEA